MTAAVELPRGPAAPLPDLFGRPLRSLRISVTDRCNMRCRYCMPEQDYVWLPRASILSFEEIDRLVGIFTGLGVDKVRLTGGEPLLRHDLAKLVALLRRHGRLRDMALTTNGILLARHASELREAGLDRVTVSLDTLRPERMQEFARSARHADVLRGIAAAAAAGLGPIKLNVVVTRGHNDDELADLIEFGRAQDAEVRFIEYMDVGGATEWSMDQVVSQREILQTLALRYGPIEPLREPGSAPAERFALADGTVFGVIASTTAPFCRSCDRSRLTADGTWLLCLYGETGLDLREALRIGRSDSEIAAQIVETWTARTDRGAEARAESPNRGALYQLASLRADPHREMHTRGG
jgi:GTP 3',8-cyclase